MEYLIKKAIRRTTFTIQRNEDCYLDHSKIFDEIIDNLSSNKIRMFVKNNSNNLIIKSNLVDAESFLTLYQKKYNVTIDRETFYNFFEELVNDNKRGIINHCLECGIDMGECNPRQLCGKWVCDYN